jgi:hypothetical protein
MSYFDWRTQEKNNPKTKQFFFKKIKKTEPFQVPKIKSFSVCPFGLTYIQSVGAIGNTFGEHIGDT